MENAKNYVLNNNEEMENDEVKKCKKLFVYIRNRKDYNKIYKFAKLNTVADVRPVVLKNNLSRKFFNVYEQYINYINKLQANVFFSEETEVEYNEALKEMEEIIEIMNKRLKNAKRII